MDHNNNTPTAAGFEQGLDAVESVVAELQAADAAPPADRHVGYQTELAGKAAQIDRATSESHLTPPKPTPPPKRPKGRLLIGSFLMGLLLAGIYIVWDGVFRYQAHGIVEANRIPRVRSAECGQSPGKMALSKDRVLQAPAERAERNIPMPRNPLFQRVFKI